jgi:PhnB protein
LVSDPSHLPHPPYRSVTPRIVVDDVAGCAAFLTAVFGATGDVVTERPVELRIGDSLVMISSLGPRQRLPAFLYVYVDDVDGRFALAVQAGATVVEQPQDQPYGDRRAMVEDPFGNLYQIASRL